MENFVTISEFISGSLSYDTAIRSEVPPGYIGPKPVVQNPRYYWLHYQINRGKICTFLSVV